MTMTMKHKLYIRRSDVVRNLWDIGLSVADIAEAVGSTPESVSSILSKKRHGGHRRGVRHTVRPITLRLSQAVHDDVRTHAASRRISMQSVCEAIVTKIVTEDRVSEIIGD